MNITCNGKSVEVKRTSTEVDQWPRFTMRCPECGKRIRLKRSEVTGAFPVPSYYLFHCSQMVAFSLEALLEDSNA